MPEEDARIRKVLERAIADSDEACHGYDVPCTGCVRSLYMLEGG